MRHARSPLLALLAVAGIFAWRGLRPAPRLDARGFVDGLPRLSADLRLTVATMDLVKTVSGESRKAAWGVDWGTTTAVVSVPARVHYAVDLSGPEAVSLRYDARRRVVTAEFPRPRVLAVELSSRRKRALVAPGWARLESLSGRALLDRLEHDLEDAVRADAESPRAVALAMGVARPALERLVADYASRAGAEGAAADVRFRDEAGR